MLPKANNRRRRYLQNDIQLIQKVSFMHQIQNAWTCLCAVINPMLKFVEVTLRQNIIIYQVLHTLIKSRYCLLPKLSNIRIYAQDFDTNSLSVFRYLTQANQKSEVFYCSFSFILLFPVIYRSIYKHLFTSYIFFLHLNLSIMLIADYL